MKEQTLTQGAMPYGTGIRHSIQLSYGRMIRRKSLSYHSLKNHQTKFDFENGLKPRVQNVCNWSSSKTLAWIQ